MTTCQIERLLEQVHTLPRLPDTTLRLIGVLNDPDSSLREIVEVVRYDTALTAELLRQCNSSYYGLGRRVTSVAEAARLLGTDTLTQLVLGAHAKALLGPEQRGYGLRPGELWRHCVAVATAAKLIGKRLNFADENLLFTAGLLHDIGKIVLNEQVYHEYARIAALASQQRIAFVEAEQRVLGCTHAEIGGVLAERWKLPEAIVQATRFHHEPSSLDPPEPLVDITHLADSICVVLGVGAGEGGQPRRADGGAVARSGLRGSDFEWIGAETIAELRAVQALFEENGGAP
jgi:putative nucleotidyltransferase with HDIG domain